MSLPNPGSDEAIALGCSCAVLDNAHGKGAQGTQNRPDAEKLFWLDLSCPVHGVKGEESEYVTCAQCGREDCLPSVDADWMPGSDFGPDYWVCRACQSE